MVEMSKVECRKDYLWGRLHAGVMADSRQRGRTDSRVDVSVSSLTLTLVVHNVLTFCSHDVSALLVNGLSTAAHLWCCMQCR